MGICASTTWMVLYSARLNGYTVKKATRAALLSAFEGVDDLLYEVVWREHASESGLLSADFFPSPSSVAAGSRLFPEYLSDAGSGPREQERPAGRPGAVVAFLRSLHAGEAGMASHARRGRASRQSEAAV